MAMQSKLTVRCRRSIAFIEKYGRILQQGYNAEFTEYGMVTRDDFQPMDAPWQGESEVVDMQIT